MTLDPRAPVLVGQGQVVQRTEELDAALDPIQLMAKAITRAISDATLAQIPNPDAMFAVKSLSTKHKNPARGVADLLG
ncbi:MAG: hypothetical protein ABI590_04805, partial [Ilumatobacteraceae bacterium]